MHTYIYIYIYMYTCTQFESPNYPPNDSATKVYRVTLHWGLRLKVSWQQEKSIALGGAIAPKSVIGTNARLLDSQDFMLGRWVYFQPFGGFLSHGGSPNHHPIHGPMATSESLIWDDSWGLLWLSIVSYYSYIVIMVTIVI